MKWMSQRSLPDRKLNTPDAYSIHYITQKLNQLPRLPPIRIINQNKDLPVQIRIEDHGKTLLPGLTVSCRIIVSEIQDVLYILLNHCLMNRELTLSISDQGQDLSAEISKRVLSIQIMQLFWKVLRRMI